MAIIGVDFSGQVGTDAPVYAVGVKYLRRRQQRHRVVYLSQAKHDEYKSCTRNWCEKLSAIMIYYAALEIYTSHDVIVVDREFMGKRRGYVERCMRKLFGERFFGMHPLNNPNILWDSPRTNEVVKKAHVKSRSARHKGMEPDERDPSFETELGWLEKL